MLTRIFIVGITYTVIGFGVALLQYYVLRRRFIGKLWGATAVALIGAFLGGAIGVLFEKPIEALSNVNGTINIFPPLLTSLLLIWIYAKIGGDV